MKSNLKELIVIFNENSFVLDYEQNSKLKLSEREYERQEEVYEKFRRNKYNALFNFGFSAKETWMTSSMEFLYFLSNKFITEISKKSDIEFTREETKLELSYDDINEIKERIPFAIGSEFINDEWIIEIFQKINEEFKKEITEYKGYVKDFILERNTKINIAGRIFFHLVENKDDIEYPFAFMATYSTKIKSKKAKHVPLKNALIEYKEDKEKLLELMSAISRCADRSEFISSIMETGELFSPLKLTKDEAYTVLKEIPIYEECSIMCRVPDWWKKKSNSLKLSISIGSKEPSKLGIDALISCNPELLLGDDKITKEEIEKLLRESEGLALIKGKWVEIDKEKLKMTLEAYEKAEIMAEQEGITIAEAMRMQLNINEKLGVESEYINLEVSNGEWLKNVKEKMANPNIIESCEVHGNFNANLRSYQKKGFSWLSYMQQLGFGACLADDMGLGKTVQIIAFLENIRSKRKANVLLILPASLIGNWIKEIEKFAPDMTVCVLHGKNTEININDESPFLYITTYGMAVRIEKIQQIEWDILILDEAQAIKNPATKQTKTIKAIKAKTKIAMTGTPIENRLSDLWSLFDFLDSGILGNAKEFTNFTKNISQNSSDYSKLRNIINPFILRRLKTDKNVISDLPEKIEKKEYTALSRKQIVLYNKLIKELNKSIKETEGIARKGLVMSSIMKFKQICNHPDQYVGGVEFKPDQSGKFDKLKEICENIYEKREKVLIFTQFKEMTEPLSDFLEQIFNKKGLVLHGGTSVKKRSEMVELFNSDEYIPYMVLSLKAGGVGLNLTAANHVIHFDRWWNPAIENQATDRAFRIGQKKNVIVHKFISAGTIEEKIDSMIEEKQGLARDIISSSGEKWITEMNNDELMELFKLTGEN